MQWTDTDFEKIFQEILEEIRGYYPGFQKKHESLLRKAFDFSHKAHQGQLRDSGSSFFIHPLKSTQHLLSIKPDMDTIVACFLHDVLQNTDISPLEIEKEFGSSVRFLCEGFQKISQVKIKNYETKIQYESIQRLFLAMTQDIRIIFIKLAERIHNLRTLQFLSEDKQNQVCRESREIFMPIADRLGLFEFKTQLEDLCLKHSHPEIYQHLEQEIRVYKEEQEEFFKKARDEFSHIFQQENFSFLSFIGRQKNLGSVYEKMKRKNLSSVREVSDIFGFRIIVRTVDECYRVLGILHSYWNPLPQKFKDYIAVPKPNGYKSIHTTLLGVCNSHLPIEIQIRTERMHADAEYGPAAHWAYKKAKHSHFDEDYIKKTEIFPASLLSDTTKNPKAFFQEISETVLTDQIFVFTRTGDIKTLPSRSTPIDFAYAIHSDVGDSCIGARVNGIIKPLDYHLRNGDVVDILTKSGRKPNPSWLSFVVSSSAKKHIHTALNKNKSHSEFSPDKLHENDREDQNGKPRLWETTKRYLSHFPGLSRVRETPPYTMVIGGEKDISHKFVKCCHPAPGKDIVAYHSRGIGSVIHEAGCKELQNLDPQRLCEAYFLVKKKFRVMAHDRPGIFRDISTALGDRGISIVDIKTKSTAHERIADTFTVDIQSDKNFHELLHFLQTHIPDILSLEEVK